MLGTAPNLLRKGLRTLIILIFQDRLEKREMQEFLAQRICRGAANHGRVAEGTRPNPEGVYSGVS